MAAPDDALFAKSSAQFQQILSRLLELPNYTWDTEIAPFHSVCTVYPAPPVCIVSSYGNTTT